MKKIVFLLLLCVACCMNAQEFHLIPKVGLNLANTTGEVDSKVRPGLNIGLEIGRARVGKECRSRWSPYH